MDFGLGLILSFTDNATTGINSAVRSLNNLTNVAERASGNLNNLSNTAQLSALSVISGQIGSSFTRMGSSIMSTFSNVIKEVTDVGTSMFYAEKQLDKLYEVDNVKGRAVMQNIADYAKRSVFNFKDLIRVVTMLKANGIEAFDEITSSSGKSTQKLMDYAADLSAFNPQMRNAYGTGIRAAMGAINEYVAEGNAVNLKRGASLDILAILGEDKGATIEERSRQVADMMEKLNMIGMTKTLADSPMQRISNLQDILYQTIDKISSSGLYDKFSALLTKFSDYIFAIPDEELTRIAKVISDALSMLLKPVDFLLNGLMKLADGFRVLVETEPRVAKLAVGITALAGGLLLVSGIALQAVSSLAGVCIVMQTMKDVFPTLSSTFRAGLTKIKASILPVTLALTALYLAWKSDFAGIRTMTTSVLSGISKSWNTATRAVNGSVEDMVRTVSKLNARNDFFGNMTIGLIKLMTVIKAVGEAWNDYTLSEDTFEKARRLGILPLIEAILDLKYRFGFFIQGFKKGWEEVSNSVINFFKGFKNNLKGTMFESLLDGLTKFFEKLSSGDPQAWYDFGNSFATITAKVLTFGVALKGICVIFGVLFSVLRFASTLTPIITLLGRVSIATFKAIASVIGFILKPFIFLGSGIMKVVQLFISGAGTMSQVLKMVFTPLQGFVMLITGIATALTSFFSMWQNGFNMIKEVVMIIGIALAGLGLAILTTIGAVPIAIGAAITAVLATLAILIHDNWESICAFFGGIPPYLKSHVINPVLSFFKGLHDGVVSLFSGIGSFIGGVIKGAVNGVISFANSAINNLISKANGVIGFINKIPGVSISKIGSISLPKLAQGGIIDSPTVAMVGEAGKEAVVPLENNTQWITGLASKLVTTLQESRVTPSNTLRQTSINNSSKSSSYMTSNNSSVVQEGSVDNSVTFAEGSIVLNCARASKEEAERMAVTIMQLIKRKKELEDMASYA